MMTFISNKGGNSVGIGRIRFILVVLLSLGFSQMVYADDPAANAPAPAAVESETAADAGASDIGASGDSEMPADGSAAHAELPAADQAEEEPGQASANMPAEDEPATTAESEQATEQDAGQKRVIDGIFGSINDVLDTVLFFDIFFGSIDGASFPFLVAWLVIGAVFLTFRMGFVNLRMFRHAYRIVRGRYQSPDAEGEVTPFQALTTALSATVGLGNIAGVAIAIMIGGPGATFWMIVAGFLGMTAKFTEATLAQTFREVRPDGHIMGGAMEYLSRGFKDRGMAGFGKAMAIFFCICALGGSIGGGNMFQVSQSLSAVKQEIPFFVEHRWVFGVIMAFIVGLVIIGGIRRIAHVAEAIVPTMVIIYVGACLWIVLSHANLIPQVFGQIFTQAFTSPEAGVGGVVGAIVQGFKRAVFSSEAGIGSAAIAHATAKTQYPVRQGIVALMEPFIDTVVICTMTALVILITGVVNDPNNADLIAHTQGAALTAVAFGTVISWFPLILTLSVVLFAFSTMISWSYYGERCWTYMLGEKYSMVYRVLFVLLVIVGSVTSASVILEFSDLIFLSMALPNYIGLYVLHNVVRNQLQEYEGKLRAGEFDRAATASG